MGGQEGRDLQHLVAASVALDHDVAAWASFPPLLLAEFEDALELLRGLGALGSRVGGFLAGDASDSVALGAASFVFIVLAHGDELGARLDVAVDLDLAADLLQLAAEALESLGLHEVLDDLEGDPDVAARRRERGHALHRRPQVSLQALMAEDVVAWEPRQLASLDFAAADARTVVFVVKLSRRGSKPSRRGLVLHLGCSNNLFREGSVFFFGGRGGLLNT